MERLTEQVPVPRGLAHRAARARRRRMAVRAAAGAGAAAVTAAAVIAATVGAGAGGAAMQARTTAYVVSRVEKALAGQHLVLRGRTTGVWGPSISWAYGPRNRFEELTGSGEPYLAVGTTLIGGKLTGVYVTYYNRKWSLLPECIPANACSRTGALEMAGPPVPTSDWPAIIRATLACGAATVTGHAQIDGVDT